MPASRSRTQEWRRSLQQILERGGALEFALSSAPVAPAGSPEANDPRRVGSDLVWRVRLLALSDTEIAALGSVTTDGIPGSPAPAPELAAARSGNNIVITWPGSPNARLQQNSSLTATGWADVPGTLGASSATLPIGTGPAFFRLAQ